MTGVFAPPKALGGRIRWLFLAFAAFNLLGVIPRALGHTGFPLAPRLIATAAAAALLGWWLHGYRNQDFPVWMIPVEGIALAAISIGLHHWVGTLGMMFVFITFRGLYGTWRDVVTLTLVVFAASVAAVAYTQPDDLGELLQQTPGVPILAALTALVAETNRRQERAAARERVFARLGASLATTTDRETTCRHATEAATELLAGIPGAWAATTLATDTGELVTTVAGPAPVDLFLGPVDLSAVPVPGDGRAEPLDDTRLAVALRTDKQRYGTLLVGAERPIPTEIHPSLETLAAQTSLGLVNAAHAADLHHQAFHDNLTGLANRSLMREHLSHALARARRGSPVAVLLIDLDGFKKVNDTYGHAAGDQLLVTVAQRLRDGIRGADTAARLGGDEFAVILDGMDASEDALLVAGRLLTAIRAPLRAAGVELRPGASIGVAAWQGHSDIDQLLHAADIAMYTAKSAGTSLVAIAEEGGTAKVLSAGLPGSPPA